MAYYSGGGGGGGGKLSAVDAILAEAADLVALEQIAKLNTAHLAADDSALPSNLEARFRKLKSLPSATAPPPPVKKTLARSVTAPGPAAARALPAPNPPAAPPAPDEPHPPAVPAPAGHEDPLPPLPGDSETKGGGSSPPQDRAPAPAPAVYDDDAEDLEQLFGSAPRGRPMLKERNRGRDSSSSASRSPSPPRQACCFGFSPKKPLQRTPSSKSKQKKVHHGSGNEVLGVDADEWGDENRRMAAELREQQRRLRKALQDQVQVSRETAKMARWVKQASARMTHVEAIDDLLSDCEDDEELR